MKIKQITEGYLNNNTYILEKDNNVLIIDPAAPIDEIEKELEGSLVGIIITHYHFDHITSLDDLVNKYNVKVYDINNLSEGKNTIKNFSFIMLKTPGHTSDSISLLFDNNLFTGDFIFASDIGRTDLPTGDFSEMQKSIAKVLKYPDDLIIYPGHEETTTLLKERANLESYL